MRNIVKSFSSVFITSGLAVWLLSSCAEEQGEVPRFSLSPTIINEGLYTQFPGRVLADQKYLYVNNPRARDTTMHILDLKTGEMLARTIPVGNGPGEFISARINQLLNGDIFAMDLNTKRRGLISADEAVQGRYQFTKLQTNKNENVYRAYIVNDSTQVVYNPGEDHLFELWYPGKTIPFGQFEIEGMEIPPNYLQGEMGYHSQRELLIYTNFYLPYISVYEYTGTSFKLQREHRGFETVPSKGGKFQPDRTKSGVTDLTLSKDYIVCKQRDYEKDDMDESTVGMDVSKLPHTVFLYSYKNLKLEGIVNLGLPVLRIACSEDNNTLYAVVSQDGQFKVARYELGFID